MNLQNHLLIAMPQMEDDYFAQSVIFICEHNEQGAMGLVINQPTDLSLTEFVSKLVFFVDNPWIFPEQLVLAGGPVEVERGFILHRPTNEEFINSYKISDRLQLTTSPDVVLSLRNENPPEKYLVALGCASWKPKQLEQEIIDNSWLVAEVDERILFDLPYEQRWLEALKLLGLTPHNLATQQGHG